MPLIYTWFRLNQDEKSGTWGVRLRVETSSPSSEDLEKPDVFAKAPLVKGGDFNATGNIIKLFMDKKSGNPKFPNDPSRQMRFYDRLFASTLRDLKEVYPKTRSEQHSWRISQARDARLLSLFLWKLATPAQKREFSRVMTKNVETLFAHSYHPAQGGFSLYDKALTEGPDLDGTGEALSELTHVGIGCDDQKRLCRSQETLWGVETLRNVPRVLVSQKRLFEREIRKALRNHSVVNSVRIYTADPTLGEDFTVSRELLTQAKGVVFAQPAEKNRVPDFVELYASLKNWVTHYPNEMGMWVSKTSLLEELGQIGVAHLETDKIVDDTKVGSLVEKWDASATLVAVGFDVLQRPSLKIIFSK